MKTYIYSRVSTDEQTTDSQLVDIRNKYQGSEIVEEKASGAKARPLLEALLAKLASGDRLIIYSLDRLGRRAGELMYLVESLNKKGVILISQREGIDFSTPSGKLIAGIFASVAEFEREILSERTKNGLKAARIRGSQIGRVPVIPASTLQAALADVHNKILSVKMAARKYGLSKRYLYQLLAKSQNAVALQ